ARPLKVCPCISIVYILPAKKHVIHPGNIFCKNFPLISHTVALFFIAILLRKAYIDGRRQLFLIFFFCLHSFLIFSSSFHCSCLTCSLMMRIRSSSSEYSPRNSLWIVYEASCLSSNFPSLKEISLFSA